MDLIHKFLNLVAPPFTFFSLMLFLPPFQVFKFLLSVLGTLFSEDLAGKVVIITGASSGIGESLAYEYAKRGACLVLAARRERSLQDVAERARDLGAPDVVVVHADVSKAEDCRKVVDQAMNYFGRLDHLVNNAGITSLAMLEEVEDVTEFRTIMILDDAVIALPHPFTSFYGVYAKMSKTVPCPLYPNWERGTVASTLDINFWGYVYMTRFALPYLRNSKGRIVVLSSSASWLPAPRMSFYNASKAAIAQFFETLRVEFGPDIGITLVTPGFIESELTQGKFFTKAGKLEVDQDMRDVQVSLIPIQTAESCARGIVRSAVRGERYVTEPAWFRVTYILKIFCPEVLEWMYRFMYISGAGETGKEEAISKKLVDYTGAKGVLYPETVQVPEIKKD